MSLKFKGTVFPQSKVVRNFPANFNKLRKSIRNYEDAETFFMLADATCSTRPKVNIEKIHVNVFEKSVKITPQLAKADRESLEILLDQELMQELKESMEDAEQGRLVPWEQVKITA